MFGSTVALGIHGLNRWASTGLEKSEKAEFKQPDCRLSQEGQEASFPIDHITPSIGVTRPSRLITHLLASHCRQPEIEAMRGR